MAPVLSAQERRKAGAYLVSRLAKQDDGRPQLAVPRALKTLAMLHPDELAEVSAELGKAITVSAARRSRSDSAYLVALMQVAETEGDRLVGAAAAKLAHGFTQQFMQAQRSAERGALARAAMPLLRPGTSGLSPLIDQVAPATFGERAAAEVSGITDSLKRALDSPALDSASKAAAAEAAVSGILQVWVDYPARKDAYLSAAQLRLLATLAPMLGDAMAAQATKNLLVAFWRPGPDAAGAKPGGEVGSTCA